MDRMYYLFLDPMQWEALKDLCAAYFRDGKAGSGFMRMAAEKVQNARHFRELSIQWGRYEEWEKTTGTSINEPEWSFMWALRDLKSFESNIRTLMAKFLGLKIKYERVLEELELARDRDIFRQAFNFEFTPASADTEEIKARGLFRQRLPEEKPS